MAEFKAVRIEVDAGAGADAREVNDLTGRLRERLREFDVESVKRASEGAAPVGSRGVDIEAIGTLIVTLVGTAKNVSDLAMMVRAWLSGRGDRTIRLEIDGDAIELRDASPAQQQQLLDEWIERHAEESTDR